MMDELTEAFADDATRLLDALEASLEALELPLPEDARLPLADGVRRRLHTIKGNSGILGHRALQDVAHRLEDAAGELGSDAARVLRLALSAVRAEVELVAREGLVEGAEARLDGLSGLLDTGREGAGPEGAGMLVQRELRVSQSRLDDLVAGVGEAAAAQARLLREVRALPRAHAAVLGETVERLGTTLAGVQQTVLSVRNLRVGTVFQRLAQLVREDARAAGKQVRLEIRGGDVELDKAVLDAVGGALVHLVRNAIAHGVELPADRVATGKEAEARVRLTAEAQGGQVILEISDDGRGVDRAAVQRRAAERGLDADLRAEELIFSAGLSTAALSTRAGRGVGLDAVRRAVDEVGGQVEVASREGQGTRFQVIVPVTLAMQRVLLVTLGDETFALPSVAVVETLDARRQTQRWLGGGSALEHRGSLVPLVDAQRVLGVQPRQPRNAVVLESQGRAALLVDSLPGHEELAFHGLEASLCQDSPASAAALAWDGRVVLRLDPGRLVRAARRGLARGAA